MKRLTAISVIAGALLGAAAGSDPALAQTPAQQPPPPIDLVATIRAVVTALPRLSWEPPAPPTAGEPRGAFKLTYYWLPSESGGKRGVQLYNKRCQPVAKVSRSFARKMRLEGGGKLRDGRVLTYSGACGCPGSPCYRTARRGHSWGTGVHARPLSPFRSVAVDPSRVSIGTVLYIPELDGLTMPGRPPYGGFVHDGCVVADDQGGGVRGRQLDLFTARRSHYRALDRRHRLKRVTVFDGGERCRSLTRQPIARRGSI
jgi:3D (Asp-Asp-Asp) domain-containing protein